MNNYDYEAEKKKHPYDQYGKVIEEKQTNGTFLLRSALQYVIDDYDEYIGSVEQSHYDDLGYYEVINFNLLDNAEVLDLSWMRKRDVFHLENNNQFQHISEIIVNIDNIGYSYLPVNENNNKFVLTVRGFDSKNNVIQQIKDFKYFIEKHVKVLDCIKLEGFPRVVESVLILCAKKYGIEIQTEKENAKKL